MLSNQSVRPVMDYRSTRWPPRRSLHQQIDKVQRQMVAILLRPPPLAGVSVPGFVHIRHRIIAHRCRGEGLWSTRHCKRVVDWKAHLERKPNKWSWPALLLHHKGLHWLQQTRVDNNSLSTGGCTRTRSVPGFVARRWHDGVAHAERMLGRWDNQRKQIFSRSIFFDYRHWSSGSFLLE